MNDNSLHSNKVIEASDKTQMNKVTENVNSPTFNNNRIDEFIYMLKNLTKFSQKQINDNTYGHYLNQCLVEIDKYVENPDSKSNITSNKKILYDNVSKQIREMYEQFKESLDKEDLTFMCEEEVSIIINISDDAKIYLSEYYIEAILKESDSILNTLTGFIYNLIVLSMTSHSKGLINVYNKYKITKPTPIRTDTVSNSIDDVMSKIFHKIQINDPELEKQIGTLSQTMGGLLKGVAETSALELEKEGASIKDQSGDIDISKALELLPRMLTNKNIQNSMQGAITKIGESNIQNVINSVMN